ncbi:hypothetical protein AALP_AAs71113U000100 [Arabis alpina]|uniref:Uncharacterized protein n=1 Tax=Arabis alpina TaxID=50452 RepID=A0A087FXT4_ARAAL|nr:hypothetical protein AALP_AAs71113U000100 [Arabis alpina]
MSPCLVVLDFSLSSHKWSSRKTGVYSLHGFTSFASGLHTNVPPHEYSPRGHRRKV